MVKNQIKLNNDKFKTDAKYSIQDLDALLQQFVTARAPKERKWKFLDSYDSGEIWNAIKSRTPKHQVLPDTNYIYYIKTNMINSLYASPYLADVSPVFVKEQEAGRMINQFMEFEYNANELGYKQLHVAERAALLNVGFMQLGWDSNARDRGTEKQGGIDYVVRDTLNVILDPGFTDFQDGRALFIYTEDSIENLIVAYPEAKPALDAISNKDNKNVTVVGAPKKYENTDYGSVTLGMAQVVIAYRKVMGADGNFSIDYVVYTAQDLIVLEYKKEIKPNYFHVVALYCNPPEKDGYGIGVPQRVIKNAMALNVLNSIAITHTYAAQRTPWVFDSSRGLSVRKVKTDINKPDRIFPIDGGDVTKVLHRLEYPQLPQNLEMIKNGLEEDISLISGIDMKYTGRDTNSISTTGGMERLQQRISMVDNVRINLIEKYARDLTKMQMDFYVENQVKQTFITKELKYAEGLSSKIEKEMTIDFSEFEKDKDNFLYSINASPQLPKTRSRLAESANMIMQVQMQFSQGGQQVQLMTPEEWLRFQDMPQKDMILDRMKLDRLHNDEEEIASEITSFDSMTNEGADPMKVVKQLAQERGMRRDPGVQKSMISKQS